MEFFDYIWESYDRLKRNHIKKQQQVSLLYGTGLYEGEQGVEFCFVPTKRMLELEQEIESLYSKVAVEDNEVVLCNEVYYTSKIEGSNTTYKRTCDIHDGKPIDHDNYFSEMMVLGGFNATKYLNVCGNRMDEPILVKMWNMLTDGARDNEDIKGEKYRSGNVGVGSHMGLNYEHVEDAMNAWLSFYNSNKLDDHPFIKAALLHFAFEYIHPFCDGNGRCGRLLMVNYLIGQGYDKFKAISFSRSIAKNYNEYYSVFAQSENSYTDCTPFLEYMLDVFDDAIYDVIYEKNPEPDSEDNNELLL